MSPAGAVVVPPTSEDQDSNDGPGDSAGGNDKGKKVKKEKGKFQNSDPSFAPNNAI